MRLAVVTLIIVTLFGCTSSASHPEGPQGKLAYILDGNPWHVELPGGLPRQMTIDGRAARVRWSPDGEWLMISLRGDAGVWVTHPDDSGGWQVPAPVATWNPRESLLAYMGKDGSIRINTADGSEERVLVQPTVGELLGNLAWHPDGSSLAYTLRHTGSWETGLWQIPTAGGAPSELHRIESAERFCTRVLGWGPGGNSVLFFQIRECASSPDGGELMATPPLRQLGPMLISEGSIALSPQGPLAMVLGMGREAWTNKHLAVLDGDDMVLWRSHEDLAVSHPAWSRDGSYLAFSAMPDAGPVGGGETARLALLQRRIYVVDTHNGQPRQVTPDAIMRAEGPRWSADNQYILFVRTDQENRSGIWAIQVSDGSARQLVDLGETNWFGYYGNTDWWYAHDYWPGPLGE